MGSDVMNVIIGIPGDNFQSATPYLKCQSWYKL